MTPRRTTAAPSQEGRSRRQEAVVRVKGVEPSRGCPHMDLNHARLPFRHTRVARERILAQGHERGEYRAGSAHEQPTEGPRGYAMTRNASVTALAPSIAPNAADASASRRRSGSVSRYESPSNPAANAMGTWLWPRISGRAAPGGWYSHPRTCLRQNTRRWRATFPSSRGRAWRRMSSHLNCPSPVRERTA